MGLVIGGLDIVGLAMAGPTGCSTDPVLAGAIGLAALGGGAIPGDPPTSNDDLFRPRLFGTN